MEDLVSIYRQCRGITSSFPQLNFYLALSVFKMAGIAQVGEGDKSSSAPVTSLFLLKTPYI